MKKNYSFKIVTISAMVLSVLALSIAYAAISQTLYINGTTTVKGNNWDIRFIDLQSPTIEGNAGIQTPATMTVTTLNFDVLLKTPNDSVTYTWKIKNNGTIDAKLSATPVLNGIDEALAKDVEYTFTYLNDNPISVDDELNSGDEVSVKLKVSLKDDATISATDTTLNLTTTLTYIQK